jgi:phospholipid/cholesterol/gamma-HCH transport system ATP-binding protein
MIYLENISKSFDGNQVLENVSLEIKKGEVVALIGGSGEGKSVLLKHVAGLISPDKGRVFVDGLELNRIHGKKRALLRDRMGFLFQGGALFDSMTVLENVVFPLKEKTKLSGFLVQERAFAELENVGLSGSEHKYPSQLSGGMIKRAAIARALVADPEIMLFDEPTTGLDPVMGDAILTLINDCRNRLTFTGIIVTHEIPKVFEYVNKVIMLHNGSILIEGTPQELISSKNPRVYDFVGKSVECAMEYRNRTRSS